MFLKLNRILAASLRAVGRGDVADQVENCHKSFSAYRCQAGHTWAKPERTCQVRLCAFEMRARAMRSLHRFARHLEGMADARYLVLTQRNVPLGQLAGGIAGLFSAFERLRHRVFWRLIRGAVVVLEISFNRKERTWHPHLNVIFDGPFLKQSEVSRQWFECSEGAGKIVWIERLRGEASAREVFKYVTKLADLADVPEAVEEFLQATHGCRFLRTYGTFFGLADEDAPCGCPDCGSQEIKRIGMVEPGSVFLDAQGVLRFVDYIEIEAPPPCSSGPPVQWTEWPVPVFPLSNQDYGKGDSYEHA